jgi:hypothetical protein
METDPVFEIGGVVGEFLSAIFFLFIAPFLTDVKI